MDAMDAIFKQNHRMNVGENSRQVTDGYAKEWAATNRSLWDGWLEQARQATQ